MRWLSLFSVAVLACACESGASLDDAGVDGPAHSFDQPIGAACNAEETVWCARGIGLCHSGLCCQFCSAVHLPRCPTGTVELHDMVGGRDVCLCPPK